MTEESRVKFACDLERLYRLTDKMADVVEAALPGYKIYFNIEHPGIYTAPGIVMLALAFDPLTAKDPLLSAPIKDFDKDTEQVKMRLHLALITLHDFLAKGVADEIKKAEEIEKEVVALCRAN